MWRAVAACGGHQAQRRGRRSPAGAMRRRSSWRCHRYSQGRGLVGWSGLQRPGTGTEMERTGTVPGGTANDGDGDVVNR